MGLAIYFGRCALLHNAADLVSLEIERYFTADYIIVVHVAESLAGETVAYDGGAQPAIEVGIAERLSCKELECIDVEKRRVGGFGSHPYIRFTIPGLNKSVIP